MHEDLDSVHYFDLSTIGRKSGNAHSVELSFVKKDNFIFILAHTSPQKKYPDWVHNLKAHPQCTITADGKDYPAKLAKVDDSSMFDWVKSAIIEKYGQGFYDTWYAASERIVVTLEVIDN